MELILVFFRSPTQGRQPDTAYGKHQSNDCDHRAEDYGRPILPGRCGDRLCHWHPPWLAFGLFACPRANEYRPIPARTPDMSSRSAAVTFGASAGISDVPMAAAPRSEEHTSELQSLMRISYAVFCL